MRIGIISLIAWEYVKQRPQVFAQELAKLGHTVFYIEPVPVTLWGQFKLPRVLAMPLRLRPVAYGVYALPGLMVPPFRMLRPFWGYNRILAPVMVWKLRRLKLDFIIDLAVEYEPVLHRLGVPFAYDHVDDTQFMEHIHTETFVEHMEKIMERSEFNVYIQEARAREDPKGVFVPNGADPEEFYPLASEKMFDAVALSTINKWFDMDSILESKKRILLIGPMDLDMGDNRKRFFEARKPNLSWIPQVEKSVANQWLSRAKVGLVPFKKDHPVVQYAMPVKILEYMMANLPVVTFRNQGIQDMYGDLVTFYGRDGADPSLDDAIDIAQNAPPQDYRGFAMQFTWQSIVSQLDNKIREVVAQKK